MILFDLGKIKIPVPPPGLVFTDRADGTLYFLSHNSATDEISLVTPVPSSLRRNSFPANEGPYLDTAIGTLRLLVRSGRLGYEVVPGDFSQAPITTWKAGERRVSYEVRAPADFDGTGELAYEKVE